MNREEKKQKRKAKIAKLKQELRDSNASQIHNYHFACARIDDAGIDKCLASAVILEIKAYGGKEIVEPVAIKDGLSPETINAIKRDLIRSYNRSTDFKPFFKPAVVPKLESYELYPEKTK